MRSKVPSTVLLIVMAAIFVVGFQAGKLSHQHQVNVRLGRISMNMDKIEEERQRTNFIVGILNDYQCGQYAVAEMPSRWEPPILVVCPALSHMMKPTISDLLCWAQERNISTRPFDGKDVSLAWCPETPK